MTDMIKFEDMLPQQSGWELMKQQANELIKSGFLPTTIKTPEQACAVMLKGRELGIPPMLALSHINIIGGKPAMSAELMLSMILKNHPKTKISYPTRSSERCEIKVTRDGNEPSVFIFTIEDAKKAGLMANPSWTKFPRAMLHARCVSEMARALFPDALSGVSYCPEELGANVNEQGEIIDVQTKIVAESATNDVVEESAHKTTQNLTSAITFDRNNRTHQTIVSNYLRGQGKESYREALLNKLHGLPFSQADMVALCATLFDCEEIEVFKK